MRPWFPVLFFSALLVLFLPTFLSSHSSRQRQAAGKSGWDALYVALVLFAVLCGFLGRRGSENDSDNSSSVFSSSAAAAAISTSSGGGRYGGGLAVAGSGSFAGTLEANRTAGVHRMRSNVPNAALKHGVAAVWGGSGDGGGGGTSSVDDWQYYDEARPFRRRSESVDLESRRFWSPEMNMMPVNTFVPLRNPSPGCRSTPVPPPTYPWLPMLWMGSVDESPGNAADEDEIYGLENPRAQSPPEVPQMQRHRRWRTLEKLPAFEMEQDALSRTELHRHLPLEQAPAVFRYCSRRNLDKPPGGKVKQGSNFTPELSFLLPQGPAPETFQATLRHRSRRRSFERDGDEDTTANFVPQMPRLSAVEPATLERHRSGLEKFRDMKEEQDCNLKVKMPRPSPLEPTASALRHRRRSLDKLPDEQNADLTREMTHPSLQMLAMSSQHGSRSRDDLPKRLAEQDTIMEQEKASALPPAPSPQEEEEQERNHKKRNSSRGEDTAEAAAEKKKKKGSKTKRKQDGTTFRYGTTTSSPTPLSSLPALQPASPPPPAQPSVIHQLFSKRRGSKSRRPPAPAAATPPQQPPPPTFVRFHEKQVESSSSPQPPHPCQMQMRDPPPPLPPPPQVPCYKKKETSDLKPASSPPRATRPPPQPRQESGQRQMVSDEKSVADRNDSSGEMKAGISAFCSSPDVNNKFEQFIARFHANLQLERMNSIREKQRRHRKRQ